MKWRIASLGFLLLGLGLLPIAQLQSQDKQAASQEQGVEVLARGPVHEAFAEPVELRPQASITVPKKPPDPIDELPPDQKPEGDDVQWIPGYWSWDEGQQDFVWVSGFWRVPPPERQWVAGYWQEVEEGWQWVPGFWAPIDQDQLTYVPPPPPSVDEGPSTPAPDDNSSYVPGCWIYRDSRYLWRPGYWMAYNPDWVWMPAHFRRSPFGFIFVEGFWDHPLHRRGLPFAPVLFQRDVFLRRDFAFSPRFAVNLDFLLVNLFVFPRGDHFCFGDYFDARFARAGFVPWTDYRLGRQTFDPDFAYLRHFQGPQWERGMRDLFAARREGSIARPPHTLVQQQQVIQNITTNNQQNVTVNKILNVTNLQTVSAVAPLAQLHNKPLTQLIRPPDRKEPNVFRLASVSREERQRVEQSARQVHQVAKVRQQEEARLIQQGGAPVRPTDPPKTVRLHPDQAPADKQPPKETRPPLEKQTPKETRPPAEKQPPKATKPPAQKQPPMETRPPAQKQPPTETRPPAEKQPPRETRPPAEKQPPRETRPPQEQRPAPRKPPPPPVMPKHEERPIPKHEAPQPVRPPRQEQKAPPPQKKDKG
jgi:hypothetical protein